MTLRTFNDHFLGSICYQKAIFTSKSISLSTLLKPFKLFVLVVFHLSADTTNPTTVSGYEDDTKEGEDGVCENRLV